MAKLYCCNTHYNTKPPIDINPLILQKYKDGRILAFCAREGTVKRIATMVSTNSFPYPNLQLSAYGWWEINKIDLLAGNQVNHSKLVSYDAIVIINKYRIHEKYLYIVNQVENFLGADHYS